MKFSIIIVTLNSEKYLIETLKSIKEQECSDYEVILKDGGSTDKTLNVFNSFLAENDNFKLISRKDRGLSDAMNQGVDAATGDYVIFLHSDDKFVDSLSLLKLSNIIDQKSQPAWGFGFYKYSNAEGEVIRSDNLNSSISLFQMTLRNIVRHQTAFVKRNCFSDISFSHLYKYAMDYDFFLKLWTKFGDPIVVREYISIFRISGDNLSSDYYSSISDEMSVRQAWRKERAFFNTLLKIFDKIVYFLRVKKLKYYHGK
jgi:glycosyltransferase involved in cell wall biosynthesis